MRRMTSTWCTAFAAAGLAFLAARPALADNCLKDADCPGEQICEEGACVISQGAGQPAVKPPAKFAKASEPAPRGAVLMDFDPDSKSEHWTVETSGNERVCEMPCKLWVGPNSKLKLRLGADKVEDVQTLDVPDSIGYGEGEKVRATPLRARGAKGNLTLVGGSLLGAGIAVFVVGMVFYVKDCSTGIQLNGQPDYTKTETGDTRSTFCSQSNTNHPILGTIYVGLGAGVAVLGSGLLALGIWSRPEAKLDLSRMAWSGKGLTVGLTADGIGGTF